jgi:hypothetical protein
VGNVCMVPKEEEQLSSSEDGDGQTKSESQSTLPLSLECWAIFTFVKSIRSVRHRLVQMFTGQHWSCQLC